MERIIDIASGKRLALECSRDTLNHIRKLCDNLEKDLDCGIEGTQQGACIAIKAIEAFLTSSFGLSDWCNAISKAIAEGMEELDKSHMH